MNQRIKSTLFHLPKIIIFGLALLNFLYIQSHIPIRTDTKISFCVVCPWYETSDFKDVLIILAASVFLLISKRWSYFIAGMLSGFVLFVGLFYIIRAVANFGLFELLQFILKQEKIFLEWEVQVVLAGLVFCFTIFYLLQGVFRIKYS
ncbi:MAG: hypothetical protein H0U50_00820 [Pyrinomonadaceae bacterium]|jgi:hypothetical protein|nr:hypothetical protein [Pyrinomonadaceae bacterium]